jgi:hypothetical protein
VRKLLDTQNPEHAPAVVTSNSKEFPGAEIWQFRKLREEGQGLVRSDHSAWFIGEGL